MNQEQDKLLNLFFQLVGGEVHLKTLRQIVTYLLELIEKPTTSSKDLARILSADPALSAKVLTVVNSSATGLRNQVSDLTLAISLLGFNQIRDIVLSVHILERMMRGHELQFIRLWKHAFYCGKIAESIAKNLGKMPGEAFTLGLLHDIGKILLCYSNERAFNTALNNFKYHAGKLQHWQSERQVLGMTHAEIGGMAATYWKFPELMYRVIWSHHSPQTGPLKSTEEYLTQVIYVADTLAWAIGFPSVNTVNPYRGRSPDTVLQENLLAPLGFTMPRFKDLVTSVQTELTKSETLFDMIQKKK